MIVKSLRQLFISNSGVEGRIRCTLKQPRPLRLIYDRNVFNAYPLGV